MRKRAHKHRRTNSEEELPFEAPLRELDREIAALKGSKRKADRAAAAKLAEEREALQHKIYANLSAWDRVCLARHPRRPVASDYLEGMCGDHFELCGDRRFGDDPAVFAGFARIDARRVVIVANRKGMVGRDRIERSFGMPRPEGFRKALRAMRLAEKFHLPVVTLIDTPGANPSVESEDRGQAHAVAENLAAMARLRVPLVSVVIGEGGCGGALAIGLADWIAMLENSYYCVVTPEGAAAVLWKSVDASPQAAEAMKLTAHCLRDLGLVDEVVPEPFAGAHTDRAATVDSVKQAVVKRLDALQHTPIDELLALRYEKYRRIGRAD